LIDEANILHDV